MSSRISVDCTATCPFRYGFQDTSTFRIPPDVVYICNVFVLEEAEKGCELCVGLDDDDCPVNQDTIIVEREHG